MTEKESLIWMLISKAELWSPLKIARFIMLIESWESFRNET